MKKMIAITLIVSLLLYIGGCNNKIVENEEEIIDEKTQYELTKLI